MTSRYSSRTDQPWWSDPSRDDCGHPIDKLVFDREYNPLPDEVLQRVDAADVDAAFVERIRRIWLRAAGQMELQFDPADVALFADLGVSA